MASQTFQLHGNVENTADMKMLRDMTADEFTSLINSERICMFLGAFNPMPYLNQIVFWSWVSYSYGYAHDISGLLITYFSGNIIDNV